MQIGSLTSPVVDVVAAGFPVVTVGNPSEPDNCDNCIAELNDNSL